MGFQMRAARSGVGFGATLTAVALLAGCAGAPRTAPVKGGPVVTGPGTVEAARKFLEGRWNLVSFEVFPPGRPAIKVSGTGTLSYDAFGNLDMQIRADQATSDGLEQAGIPIAEGVLSTTGRTAIDMQARTLTYILEGQPGIAQIPRGTPVQPLSMTRPRHWEVMGDVLTLTTRGDDGQPVSVGRWQKQP